jgi:hypothetical protein
VRWSRSPFGTVPSETGAGSAGLVLIEVAVDEVRTHVRPPLVVTKRAGPRPLAVASSATSVPSFEVVNTIEPGLFAPPGRVLVSQVRPPSLEYWTKSYRTSPISRSQMSFVPKETIPTMWVSETASASKMRVHRSPASIET